MANVTIATEVSAVPTSNLLFSGLKFWVGHQIPQRSWLLEQMRINGATIVTREKEADICLIDHCKKFNLYLDGDFFSYKFVEESIRTGSLQPLGRYKVSTNSPVQSSVSSYKHTGKRLRNKFTEEDDRILYDTIMPLKNAGRQYRGVAIYKRLEAQYPHHTHQSWRSRFLDYVEPRSHKPENTQSRVTDDGAFAAADNGPPSPKRRRLEGPTDTPSNSRAQISHAHPPKSPHPNTEPRIGAQAIPQPPPTPQVPPRVGPPNESSRSSEQAMSGSTSPKDPRQRERRWYPNIWQCLEADPTLRRSITNRKFTLKQADKLYQAVPYICVTPDETVDDAWNEMSTDFDSPPMHSVRDWKTFYTEVILPAYMTTNNLVGKNDLMRHAEVVVQPEMRHSTPEIKQENTDTVRTPEDIQRERELERARKEDELQMSSDDEEDEIEASEFGETDKHVKEEDDDQMSSVSNRPGASCLFFTSSAPISQREVTRLDNVPTEDQPALITKPAPEPKSPARTTELTPKKKLFGHLLHTHGRQDKSVAAENGLATSFSNSLTENPTMRRDHPEQVPTVRAISNNNVRIQVPPLGVNNAPEVAAQYLREGTDAETEGSAHALPQTVNRSVYMNEPPESGQRFPDNLPISQSSTQSTELPVRDKTQNAEANVNKPSTQKLILASSNAKGSIDMREEDGDNMINLVDADVDENDETYSEKALSDTGSEYMAFDEEPERSQLWATSFSDDISDEQEQRGSRYREGTPRRPGNRSEESDQDSFKSAVGAEQRQISPQNDPDKRHSDQSPMAQGSQTAKLPHEVETQALFERSLPETVPSLDVPPPEGGWELLSLDEGEYEEFNTVLETTELPVQPDNEDRFHEARLEQEKSLSPTTDLMTTPPTEHSAFRTVAVSQRRNVVIDISSDSEDDTERTIMTTRINREITPPATRPRKHATQTDPDNSSSSDSDDSPQSKRSRILDLQQWFSTQRTRHINLPNPVFHRLASAAAQATTLNLPTAGLVLQIMAQKFVSMETSRQRQCRAMNRAFRHKQTLSEEEARSLVPDNTWGVWTIVDDRALLSRTEAGVRAVEARHGADGTHKRSRFLRARYAAPNAAVGNIGKDIARQALSNTKARHRFTTDRDIGL